MSCKFPSLLRRIYRKELHSGWLNDNSEIFLEEIVEIYRSFMNKVAMRMIVNEFEDEKTVKALLRLGRVTLVGFVLGKI